MSRPIRVGIIGAHLGAGGGAGSWGMRAHIPALLALPGFEPVAIATTSEVTARASAEACGIPHAFGDPAALAHHPDVDLVAICVRVPHHSALVTAALAAGKHVYCEWPLGRDTADAVAMAEAAEQAGVVHFTGLQGRRAPAMDFVRDLIGGGEIGAVRACSLNHSVPWPTAPTEAGAYLQTRESGANYFTIPGGHSIDTITYLLGHFERVAAVSRIQVPDLRVQGSGEALQRTSPDQIAIAGILESGIVASLRFQGASAHGGGIRLEINGEKGDLLIAPVNPQASMLQIWDLAVSRTTGLGLWEQLPIPARYFDVPAEVRTGPPLNVARSYLALEQALLNGKRPSPDFRDAVALHRTLDAIEASAI